MRGWLAVRAAGLQVDVIVIPMQDGPTAAIKAATPAGLVPYLEHEGARIWESLAICEYCAEHAPALWPADRIARAEARAIAAEMHAGFRGLRTAMPMNLCRDFAGHGQTPDCLADLARIDALWGQALARSGGPFLFGAAFGAADAMFAPVAARILTYRPAMSDAALRYCNAVRRHPLVDEWYDAASKEPAEWMLAKYERPTA